MSNPLAYFLTWHTHGSWLHGDQKGSVDHGHSEYATPLLSPDPPRLRRIKPNADRAIRLEEDHRICVQKTMLEVAAYRKWSPFAIHVRTTHVHVVIRATASPEKTLVDLKAYCTRRLRESEAFHRSCKIWSEHGSTRYLWDGHSVKSAVRYVFAQQGAVLVPGPYVDKEFRFAD